MATPHRCSTSIEKTATSRESKRCLSSLLAQRGVLRLGHDGNLRQEEGLPTVAFLTCAHAGIVALTQHGIFASARWS